MYFVLDYKVQEHAASQFIPMEFDFFSPLFGSEGRNFLSKLFVLLIECGGDFFGAARRVKGNFLSGSGERRAYENGFCLGYMTNQLAHRKHVFFWAPVKFVVGCGSQDSRGVFMNSVPVADEAIGIGTAHCVLLSECGERLSGHYPVL